MATVHLKGNPVQIGGNLPQKGQTAPDFQLADAKRNLVSLDAYAGKRKVLNIFPSIDTPTCATSVRTFNQKASSVNNTVVSVSYTHLRSASLVKLPCPDAPVTFNGRT